MDGHKVTITGGTGFIGSALVKHFRKKFSVRVLDKRQSAKEFEGRVESWQCDIRNYNEVERGLEDTDLVIHTAIVQIPQINEAKELGHEVNVLGTQNICKAVDENPSIKGMILAGSWHLFGERGLKGIIDEGFGFRPDKVEDRARLYALSKIAQETIARFYDEMSKKIYGVIRMGTVLGKGMPEKNRCEFIHFERAKRGPPDPLFAQYVQTNALC